MDLPDWDVEFPASITICDPDGVILGLNERAARVYEKDGGADLLGRSALDCHPEPARTKFKEMLRTGQKNTYTIEKNGVKKMICHSPWYRNGTYAGFVELMIEIPFDMPHFIRTAAGETE